MTSQSDLVLENLRLIRKTLDEHTLEFHMLGSRMSALESHMATLMSQLPPVWEEIAGLKRRIERIEHRLELVDTIT